MFSPMLLSPRQKPAAPAPQPAPVSVKLRAVPVAPTPLRTMPVKHHERTLTLV